MGTAVARRNEAGGEIEQFLRESTEQLRAALPAHLTPERVMQAAIAAIFRTPDLLECDRLSILASIVQCSQLGLELTPALGHGWLLPWWNDKAKRRECQFMPGYRGFLHLAHNSKQFRLIQARVVREGEVFEYEYDPDLRFRHRPDPGNRGPVTHAYCYAKVLSGESLVEVMTAEEIERVRARSKAAGRGPWVSDWDEMAKKTVTRRFLKTQPCSTEELARAMEIDNSFYDMTPIEKPPPDHKSGYGRTQQYASPEQTREYSDRLAKFIDLANARWADRLTQLGALDRELPKSAMELLNVWQANGHLLKWCIQTERLDPSINADEAKVRQAAPYLAVVYHRDDADRKALSEEMRRYAEEQARVKLDAIFRKHPDLKPVEAEEESQAPPGDGWEEGVNC